MHKQLDRIIAQCPYKVHVIVEDYNTNEIVWKNRGEEIFSSASIIKVPILITILAHLQKTNSNLNHIYEIVPENMVEFSVITEQRQIRATLHELLLWMTITSDNTATNVCIDLLGMDAFNNYFKEIGLHNTRVQRKMMDFERQKLGFDNETTAEDMQHLFRQIYRGTLLTKEWNAIALDILSRQRSHESLKRYIVDDVKMAHKTGGLDTVDHDTGIIFTKERDYFIGVFITEVTDNEKARQLIGTISKIVYDHFTKKEEGID
ncbi:serine hydrolase [Solibacillus isronensis]|uniref:serine hydrolase n=1 Tax=Solibacillus isronensis TaxID=412383 RepID=UPI0009A73C64|nr:serine hydrolase [Solibacillus isronensis]